MKQFIAIVSTEGSILSKFMDFDSLVEAQNHINIYGGFATEHPGGNQEFWVVNMTAKTVVIDTDTQASVTAAREMSAIRAKRDAALAETDWAALPDSPTMSSAMATYRAALRDYPATYTANNLAVFPTIGE
tara:strand:+ start:542 stop:934 length:393 start_codon:yes stop_codon:yes gene_type:complete